MMHRPTRLPHPYRRGNWLARVGIRVVERKLGAEDVDAQSMTGGDGVTDIDERHVNNVDLTRFQQELLIEALAIFEFCAWLNGSKCRA